MLQAVRATYDGKNFVPDENLNLAEGQKVIVTILDDKIKNTSKKMSEEEIHAWIKKFSGSCGKMFNGTEEVDAYIKELREDRNILGDGI